MKTSNLTPLKTGDLALRFRVDWRGTLDGRPAYVTGLEVVEVISVSGETVTWTNHRRARGGEKFYHASDRRELLALAAIENLGDAGSAAAQVAGGVDANKAAAVSPSPRPPTTFCSQ